MAVPIKEKKVQQESWFGEFWSAYPRKIAKETARRAFLKQVTSEGTFETVMKALASQNPAMLAREEQYRPHASTWLNGARWLDQVQVTPSVVIPVEWNSPETPRQSYRDGATGELVEFK